MKLVSTVMFTFEFCNIHSAFLLKFKHLFDWRIWCTFSFGHIIIIHNFLSHQKCITTKITSSNNTVTDCPGINFPSKSSIPMTFAFFMIFKKPLIWLKRWHDINSHFHAVTAQMENHQRQSFHRKIRCDDAPVELHENWTDCSFR